MTPKEHLLEEASKILAELDPSNQPVPRRPKFQELRDIMERMAAILVQLCQENARPTNLDGLPLPRPDR